MTVGNTAAPHQTGDALSTLQRSATRAPLGLDQERLWLVEQFQPASNTYNISFGLHISGEFDIETLRSALAKVVDRHEGLRAIVQPDKDGRPGVHILPSLEIPIGTVDLRDISPEIRPSALRAEMDQHVQQPFDLSIAPLMRILVIRDGDSSHYVVETSHHSVIDRWSYVRFNQELFGFYREQAFGVPYSPPELPLQFYDFAVRQRIWLEENREQIREFWSTYLDGVPTRGTLPYDYPHASTDRSGAHCNFIVDDEVASGIIQYARKNRMTLNSALIGAYAAVLFERTGNRDIVIGFPSVVRNDPDLNNIIGFLLTNIPIRVRIPEHPTLASIIKEVRNATADISGFEDTPYSEVIAAISPKRTADEYPLIQTMASSLEFEEELFDYEAGEISIVEVMDGVSPNDMTLGFWKSGERLKGGFQQEGLHGRLEYRTALFHPRTIETLVNRLLEFLADIADGRADQPVLLSGDRVKPQDSSVCGSQTPLRAQEDTLSDHELRVQALTNAWSSVLETSDLHPSDDFFERGGNSLLAVRLGRLLRQAGYSLPAREIFANSGFAGMLASLRPLAVSADMHMASRDQAPASPEQLRFLESDLERPERWAHSVVLECDRDVSPVRIKQALDTVVSAHRALTTKIERSPGGWRMLAGGGWHWQKIDAVSADTDIIDSHLNVLDLSGPLFCATWVAAPKPRLVLTASHLIIDGLSWAILEQELSAAYRGEAVPAEERDHFDYASTLAKLSFDDQLPFWREQVDNIAPLPGTLSASNYLSAEQSFKRFMHAPVEAFHGQAEAITALASALASWQKPAVLDIVASGREALPGLAGWDPSRAIGNYACLFPLLVSASGTSLEDDAHAAHQALNAVPFGGKGFGALRYFARALPAAAPAVCVNYVGRLTRVRLTKNAIFLSRRDVGSPGNPDSARSHVLNLDISMQSGGAELNWRTNPDVLTTERFEQIAAATSNNLLALIERPELSSRGGRLALPQAAVNAHFAMLCARGREARSRAQELSVSSSTRT